MKNEKCTMVANISVVTEYPGKKKVVNGKFEKRIEQMLMDAYVQYLKHLVSKLPESAKYEWKFIKKNTLELVDK